MQILVINDDSRVFKYTADDLTPEDITGDGGFQDALAEQVLDTATLLLEHHPENVHGQEADYWTLKTHPWMGETAAILGEGTQGAIFDNLFKKYQSDETIIVLDKRPKAA